MTKRNCIAACATAMMALAATATLAAQPVSSPQGQGRGRGNAPAHTKFDDHDRQATRTWYDANQQHLPNGFRDRDRLSAPIEQRFQEGYVIDRSMRGQVHSLPSALLHLLAPAPRSYRYVVIGDQVVLIDSGYRVYDVIRLGRDR
jgi:Ni/Co efflux regulator RcnB